MQALQGYLAFEVSVKPKTTKLNFYRAAFVIVTVVGIACAITMTRRNGALDDQMHHEVHQTAGEVHQIYDFQIGHPSPSVVLPAPPPNRPITRPAKVNFVITSVFTHAVGPPPARLVLKLWVNIRNSVGAGGALIGGYSLLIKVPGKGEFICHVASPFEDDLHFESLESQTGNQPIKAGGEVHGNLMFLVDGVPVPIDSDPNIQFVLSAYVNGKIQSVAETSEEIANYDAKRP